jgi:transglutaminase-like putative cysteine protease
MRFRILAIVCLCVQLCWAEDKKYAVAAIPEALLKDVDAVVREDQTIFRVQGIGKGMLRTRFVVTILNNKANRYAHRSFGYDKLSKITELKANVYDAKGESIKKLRASEIYDHSSFDGSNLFSDNREKSVDLSQTTYPYTVEYEFEMEYRYLYSIPGTTLLPSEKVSAERVTYQIIYPTTLPPRYKLLRIDQEPIKSKLPDGSESVSWTFNHVLPIKLEPAGPVWDDVVPQIMAGPTLFEYNGYQGNMGSWETYGQWQLTLNHGRDVLSDATRQKVKELTQHLTTTEEKTKVLYEYLQSKTRYVSIQEGIGGVQPFPSQVVEQNSYGDCKALSNFMVALLADAGIKGYYTKIRAGRNESEIEVDFPSHQTNHIIVAVPNKADTLWLECTSQTNPFGFLGRFTDDRYAIMVAETGGKIVRTPRYPMEKNKQVRKGDVFLQLNGDAKASVKTTYSGLQYENENLDGYLNSSPEEQKKWLQENTGIPSFDIASFSFENKRDKIPSAIVSTDLVLNRLAAVSGKRLFMTPNLMNRSTYIPEKVENRKMPVIRKLAYDDIDTIRYHMPEGLYPEFLPPATQFKSQFGDYESSVQIDKGDVIYVRRLRMRRGEFPAESYSELIDFFKNINKADNTKIVFLNKT